MYHHWGFISIHQVLGEKYGRREEGKQKEVKNKGQGKNTTTAAPPVKNNTVRIVGKDSISGIFALFTLLWACLNNVCRIYVDIMTKEKLPSI